MLVSEQLATILIAAVWHAGAILLSSTTASIDL
jgi:hypothetical protein